MYINENKLVRGRFLIDNYFEDLEDIDIITLKEYIIRYKDEIKNYYNLEDWFLEDKESLNFKFSFLIEDLDFIKGGFPAYRCFYYPEPMSSRRRSFVVYQASLKGLAQQDFSGPPVLFISAREYDTNYQIFQEDLSSITIKYQVLKAFELPL